MGKKDMASWPSYNELAWTEHIIAPFYFKN